MVPKGCRVLILGTCECVSLYGKRDFADVIKELDMNNFFFLLTIQTLNVITKILIRDKAESQSQRRCDNRSRGQRESLEDTMSWDLRSRRTHKSGNADSTQKLVKARKEHVPWSFQQECRLADHPD